MDYLTSLSSICKELNLTTFKPLIVRAFDNANFQLDYLGAPIG